ncbi:hypothetical protein LC085_18885 [Bacillus tianshenii]|uniref:hypothetical protein n=1 Tax=Sutcliffiella tianshenii TaxID=1463404 RepID=UPI001CD20607|nr:hypothetical protein [Bacillus tianshenii]MCA1321965.1 hypothetical protein [Bacillus tianshenii]
MDFINSCKNELNNIECCKISFYGDDYYSLECIQSLPRIIEKINLLDELMITPYHFINGEIAELYEYKLSIRIVKTIISKEQFFLEETGKKNLDDIPFEILELLDYTYYETLKDDKETFINSLKRYTSYMTDNETEIFNKVILENGGHDGFGVIYYEIL